MVDADGEISNPWLGDYDSEMPETRDRNGESIAIEWWAYTIDLLYYYQVYVYIWYKNILIIVLHDT